MLCYFNSDLVFEIEKTTRVNQQSPTVTIYFLCRLSSLVETHLLSFIYFDTRFWNLADRYCFENPSEISIKPSQLYLD